VISWRNAPGIYIQDEDGTPNARFRRIRVTNGTLTDNGDGSCSINIAAASGAPAGASYIAVVADATLTNERVLTAGSALALTDAGAGNAITIDFDGGTAPSNDLGGTWQNPTVVNTTASASPTTDHTGNGIQTLVVAGQTLSIGQIARINSSGEYALADADAAASMPAVGLAVDTLAATATGTLMLQGYFRDDTYDWTVGGLLYASSTAGSLTHTVPSNSGQQVQVLGYAVSADTIYFNPSLVLVEIA